MTGGILGGPIDTRRVIEALIGASVGVGIYKLLSPYIHSSMLLYICGFIGLILFAAGLIGGNGEPLSVFIFNFINYERRRYFVTLRPPMPDFEEDRKKKTEASRGLEKKMLSMKGRRKRKGGDAE